MDYIRQTRINRNCCEYRITHRLMTMLVYENGELKTYPLEVEVSNQHDAVFRTMHKDKKGNIYLGTRGHGLFVLSEKTNEVKRVECSNPEVNLNNTKVWSIFDDNHSNLWIGCQQKGLLMLQLQKNKPSKISHPSLNLPGCLCTKGFWHGRDFFNPSHNPPMTLLCEESRWEGYGRDDGRDQGRDENQRILYIKGFRAIDGRDGGFSDKNYR